MLEVICGPMFSGKSEELIRRLRRYEIAGKKVRAFGPDIDNRYGEGKIHSHSGAQFDCTPIPVEGIAYEFEADVIGFDEAQFFEPKWLLEAISECIEEGAIIIVAGLDQTYRTEPFGAMPTLLAWANKVDKLTAICNVCGSEANRTQRLVDGDPAPFSGPTIQVGGFDSYEARCDNCFERG